MCKDILVNRVLMFSGRVYCRVQSALMSLVMLYILLNAFMLVPSMLGDETEVAVAGQR